MVTVVLLAVVIPKQLTTIPFPLSSVSSSQFSRGWQEEGDQESMSPEQAKGQEVDRLGWIVSDPNDEPFMSYVNLLDNPETNTGLETFHASDFLL